MERLKRELSPTASKKNTSIPVNKNQKLPAITTKGNKPTTLNEEPYIEDSDDIKDHDLNREDDEQ